MALFGKRRDLTRSQLRAIHAKRKGELISRRDGIMRALGEHRDAWSDIASRQHEQAKIAFVGKYGRAQRGRTVSQGTMLGRAQYALSRKIEKAGHELEKVDKELKDVRNEEVRRYVTGGLIAGSALGAGLLVGTPWGRRVLAKGATRFRPLAPLEKGLKDAKFGMEEGLRRGADATAQVMKEPAIRAHGELFDYFMGTSPTRWAKRQKQVAEGAMEIFDESKAHVPLSAMESNAISRSGLIDRISDAAKKPLWKLGERMGWPMSTLPKNAPGVGETLRREAEYAASLDRVRDLREAMMNTPLGGVVRGMKKFGLQLSGPKGRMGEARFRGPGGQDVIRRRR